MIKEYETKLIQNYLCNILYTHERKLLVEYNANTNRLTVSLVYYQQVHSFDTQQSDIFKVLHYFEQLKNNYLKQGNKKNG